MVFVYVLYIVYQTIVEDVKKHIFEQIAGCVMEAVWTNSSIMCNAHIVTGEAAAFQA